MPSLYAVLFFACVFLGINASELIYTKYTCTSDDACRQKQYLDETKLDSGAEVAYLRDGTCCGGKYCYTSSLQQCKIQDNMPDAVKAAVCNKKGFTACGGFCCNDQKERCEKYTEVNGHVVANCLPVRFDNSLGFWTVALPLILSIFTLAGLGVTVAIAAKRRHGLGKGEKAILALSIVFVLFGMPFYFSSAWQYGVTIALSCAVGVLSLGVTSRSLSYFNVYVQVALFLAMLGWGTGNTLWGHWGEGILDPTTINCSPRFAAWFHRDATTSYAWSSAAAAARAGANYALAGFDWGYCDQDWFVALWVFGAIGICLSALLLAGHAALLAKWEMGK